MTGAFVTDSSVYARIFAELLPLNFFFSRVYGEVTSMLGSILSEKALEQLVCYLISFNRLECCYFAEKLLKERQPLS